MSQVTNAFIVFICLGKKTAQRRKTHNIDNRKHQHNSSNPLTLFKGNKVILKMSITKTVLPKQSQSVSTAVCGCLRVVGLTVNMKKV